MLLQFVEGFEDPGSHQVGLAADPPRSSHDHGGIEAEVEQAETGFRPGFSQERRTLEPAVIPLARTQSPIDEEPRFPCHRIPLTGT